MLGHVAHGEHRFGDIRFQKTSPTRIVFESHFSEIIQDCFNLTCNVPLLSEFVLKVVESEFLPVVTNITLDHFDSDTR